MPFGSGYSCHSFVFVSFVVMIDKQKDERPEWVPEERGEAFATRVMAGVYGGHDGLPGAAGAAGPARRPAAQLSVDDYVQGVLTGNRTVLARAITLVESNLPAHEALAQEVLRRLLPGTGQAIRIGITGVPGVGKSTFIEAFGCFLTGAGHRLAVLAVDPSSARTRGSILGDKTRMEKLSRDPAAFIRPSPAGGTLGGVHRKTRETMLLCEAAGFDVILVETVGVGQSEFTVRSMVDFFLLLMLAGAGDELQGIKKGIMELADALVITKADGENRSRAELARAEFERALHYMAPATEGWQTRAYTCSAVSGSGIEDVWKVVEEFVATTRLSGVFEAQRRQQLLAWVGEMVHEHLHAMFYQHPAVQALLPRIEREVLDGRLPATTAARELLRSFARGEAPVRHNI